MNEKHKAFCLEYLKDFNATRAYRAVYDDASRLKNPRAAASRLLHHPDVAAFLAEEKQELGEKRVAEAREVLAYFTSVMRGEIEMSDRERNKAGEILAKRYGLLDEKCGRRGRSGYHYRRHRGDEIVSSPHHALYYIFYCAGLKPTIISQTASTISCSAIGALKTADSAVDISTP